MEIAPQSEWILERVVIGGVIRLQPGVSTIGRNPNCTITVASNYVSRNHAEFYVFPDRDHIQVKDLGSTNGIFINGIQSSDSLSKLRPGDRIGIGVTVDNEDITDNHQIFILKQKPFEELSHVPPQNYEENDLEIVPPSPEPKTDLNDKKSEEVVVSDSEYDEDDNEDDFVQPEDIDDNDLANLILPPVSPFNTHSSSFAIKNEVRENIQSIFGDLNQELLDNLPQNIREIAAPTRVQKMPVDNEIVYISSDDEDDANKRKSVKSPELFGDSFNEDANENCSREGEPIKSLVPEKQADVAKTTAEEVNKIPEQRLKVQPPNSSTPSELSTATELSKPSEAPVLAQPVSSSESVKPEESPVPPKPPEVFDDGADEEEELIFTQKMLDEAREELSDSESEHSFKFNIDELGDLLASPIAQEPSFTKKNETIDLDDDDEYDEVLESKVNLWSLKLSQSFSSSFNHSQIYEDDLDNAPKIKTEKIFIDDESDEEAEASTTPDDIDENRFERGAANTLEGEQLPEKKASDITESPLLRGWKRGANRNFIFSSSDEEEPAPAPADSAAVEPVSKTKVDIKRSRTESSNEAVPKKKSCLRTPEQEKEKKTTTVDKSNKKSATENAESLFDSLKNSHSRERGENSSNSRKRPNNNVAPVHRSASTTERRNSSNYLSAKFARSISAGNHSFLEDLDDVFDDCKEVKVSEKEPIAEPVVEPTAEPEQRSKSKPESAVQRRPPTIITPPPLPVKKGKLRGVSAVQRKTVEVIKDAEAVKDLKRKFLEKPSIAKKKAELMSKEIKEDRKQKLKDLANKKTSEAENTKEVDRKKVEKKNRDKPKVKVTSVNRGAFLAQESSSNKPYRIPKKPSKSQPPNSSNKPTKTTSTPALDAPSSTTVPESSSSKPAPCPTKSSASNTEKKSMKETLTDFSAELLKADTAIVPSTTNAFRERQKSVDVPHEQKQRAPPRRNSKKLTFEAMEQHFEETIRAKELQNKLGKQACKPSSLSKKTEPAKKKKKVRFNDVPQIRYIEKVARFIRKVDQKESTTFNERKNFIRRRFPIVDLTDELLSDVLAWSHEWMRNKERCLGPTDDVIYPMTDQFSSIEQYKSVVFPLLKIEYFAHLERQMLKHATQTGYKIIIDSFSHYKNRELIFARSSTRIDHAQLGNTDLALVNVKGHSSLTQCLAYISNIRRNDKWSIVTMEVIPNIISKDQWRNATQITINRVIEGLRVHFGSFNAVHQLSQTPLFRKILNPLELLKVKSNWHPSMEYKGCDPMNTEQKEILLKTYAAAIDESNPNISLIKGPPGTGKSRLITNLTLQLLYGNEIPHLDKKVLICAQSNMAVDVIARQLYHIQKKLSPRATKYHVIRFGKEERVSKDLMDITLSKLIARDQVARLQRNFEANQASEMSENLSQEILKLETRIAALEKENVRDVRQDELIELRRNLALKKSVHNQTLRPEDEKKLYPQYLENANIVCTTLSSCVKLFQ